MYMTKLVLDDGSSSSSSSPEVLIPLPKASKVLGQGAYGCVIKPPAKCKKTLKIPKSAYEGAVSKLLSVKNQKIEMKEYKRFSAIDPNGDWFMPSPIACEAEDERFSEFAQCTMRKKILANPTPHALLIMRDGGIDLSKYCEYIRSLDPTTVDNNRIFNAFNAGYKVFEGLDMSSENDLIHFDMKQQNIVYDEKNAKMLIIDFGMSSTFDDAVDEILHRFKTDQNTNHWSYPPEMFVYGKETINNLCDDTYDKTVNECIMDTINYVVETEYGIHSKSRYYDKLVKHIMGQTQDFINDFITGLQNIPKFDELETNAFYKTKKGAKYIDDAISQSIETIDSYGAGMSMMCVLRAFTDLNPNVIPPTIYDRLTALFLGTVHGHPDKRFKLPLILKEYKNILTDYELLLVKPISLQQAPIQVNIETESSTSLIKSSSLIMTKEIVDLVSLSLEKLPPVKKSNRLLPFMNLEEWEKLKKEDPKAFAEIVEPPNKKRNLSTHLTQTKKKKRN